MANDSYFLIYAGMFINIPGELNTKRYVVD